MPRDLYRLFWVGMFLSLATLGFTQTADSSSVSETPPKEIAIQAEPPKTPSIQGFVVGDSLLKRKMAIPLVKINRPQKIRIDTSHYLNAPNADYGASISFGMGGLEQAISEAKEGIIKPSNSIVFDARYYLFIGVLLLSAFFLPFFTDNSKSNVEYSTRRPTPLISPSYMGFMLFAITCLAIFVSNYLSRLNIFDEQGILIGEESYTLRFFIILLGYYFLGHLFVVHMMKIYQPHFLPMLYRYHFWAHIGMMVASFIILLLVVTDIIVYDKVIFVFVLLGCFSLEFLLQIAYLLFKRGGHFAQKVPFVLLAMVLFSFLKLGIVIFVFKQFA